MSFQATRWARDQVTGSPYAKGLLMVLAEHVGDDEMCFLSTATLAERAEMGRTATLKYLDALESCGLIVRARRNDQFGHRTSDTIRLMIEETQGPRDGLRDDPKVREADLGEPPKSAREGSKVRERAVLSPPGGPYLVSEKKILKREKAASPRAKPSTSIPEGFPDQGAIERERSFLRDKGWNIDAGMEAEKFRSYSLNKGRTGKDWAAGFHGWIVKAIEFAPATARIAAPVDTPTVSAPPPWRARLKAFADPKNGHWNDTDWGPRPGKAGCVVPVEVAAEFGFGPANVVPLSRAGAG